MKNNYAYDVNQLVWDVINEAVALREHATAEERGKLDFTTLDAGNSMRCVYGQMTGHCHSERAGKLIQLCTPRYFATYALSSMSPSVERIVSHANGEYVKDFLKERASQVDDTIPVMPQLHFRAIEVFISLDPLYPEQVKSLVSYLRGESDDLNVYIF